jgi:hypothetical protein
MSTHNLTWTTDGSDLYRIDADGGRRAWSPTDPDAVVQIGADVLPALRNVIVRARPVEAPMSDADIDERSGRRPRRGVPAAFQSSEEPP